MPTLICGTRLADCLASQPTVCEVQSDRVWLCPMRDCFGWENPTSAAADTVAVISMHKFTSTLYYAPRRLDVTCLAMCARARPCVCLVCSCVSNYSARLKVTKTRSHIYSIYYRVSRCGECVHCVFALVLWLRHILANVVRICVVHLSNRQPEWSYNYWNAVVETGELVELFFFSWRRRRLGLG